MIIRRKLRDYQERALDYCRGQAHPALFLQMRLGKTLITIRRLRELGANRILVVAPNSALGSWEDELELEQESRVYRIGRASRESRRKKLFDAVSVTCGKNAVRAWVLINKEAHLALPQLADVCWDAVVLDESTFIANPKSRVSNFFVKNFRGVSHRFALTGTPNPESDLQLVQQMLWLDSSYLGYRTFWQFRAQMCESCEEGHSYFPTQEARKLISSSLEKKAFVLGWKEAGLNVKKIRCVRRVEMPDKFMEVYRKLEEEFLLEYDDQEINRTVWTLTRYHWLRRLAGGFMQLDPDDPTPQLVWDGKVREVVDLLFGELSTEQVVIWFNYNLELHTVNLKLQRAGLKCESMHGELTVDLREERRRAFQKGDIRVLCVQQAVAQMGMNLSAAGAAYYYSEPVGLLARKQTEDRTIDVTDRKGTLYVHSHTQGTVDEDIYEANKMKSLRSSVTLGKALVATMMKRRS